MLTWYNYHDLYKIIADESKIFKNYTKTKDNELIRLIDPNSDMVYEYSYDYFKFHYKAGSMVEHFELLSKLDPRKKTYYENLLQR